MARKPVSKAALTLRGAIGVAVLVGLIVYTTVASTGALSGYPEITASVPASNVGVSEQAAVEYKGVVVGKVVKTVTEQTTSTITMRIYDRQAAGISSGSTVRVLPRTLFGDQFVQLVPPDPDPGTAISDGDFLEADTSDGTVQLYEAYVRLTELLSEIEPHKISSALHAMAQLLDGRGERFGRMIDQLYDLTDDVPRLLRLVDDGMEAASTLSAQLAEAAPDGIKAMRDAIVLSETVVAEQRTLNQVLTSGHTLATEATRLASSDNVDRFIELAQASDPIIDTLAANPQGLPNTIGAARTLLEKGIPTFSTGPWFRIRANLTTKEPRPYTVADCPRYPGLDGPNCGAATARSVSHGGSAGDVGSSQERDALAAIMRAAPRSVDPVAGSDEAAGAVGVLLGPLVRGTQVMTR